MNIKIRNMTSADTDAVLSMMRTFYSSAAVYTNGSDEIFTNDIRACVSDDPFIEGYILEADSKTVGYAMTAKSYSTEFGKRCIWIEDLYIIDKYRGLGIGRVFFDYITEKYDGALFRLEVEAENERAVKLYKKCGFTTLPYMEMIK